MMALATDRIRYRSWVIEHDRAGEGVQGVLQHVAGLDVQVVGRLVEAEQVGRVGHQLGQRQPGLLAAREDLDLLLDCVAGEEEGAQQPAHLGRAHPRRGPGQLLEDGVVGVQRLDLMLGEVGDPHVAAQLAAYRPRRRARRPGSSAACSCRLHSDR